MSSSKMNQRRGTIIQHTDFDVDDKRFCLQIKLWIVQEALDVDSAQWAAKPKQKCPKALQSRQ